MKRPAVLMTDPRHFAIRGGANPHTRNADDSLKRVELSRAWPQWHRYVDALLDHGVDVYVVDAAPGATGMVFAANAGLLTRRLDPVPTAQKVFYPSHFTPVHRRAESPLFTAFMDDFGFETRDYDAELRFEGEADAFIVGRGDDAAWLVTYGFRSDPRVAEWLEAEVLGESGGAGEEAARPTQMRLTDPRYYHGDCLLCDLGGPFLAWPGGLDPDDWGRARDRFGDRIVEMNDDEAAAFVGNSFYVEVGEDRLLFSPAVIGERTIGRIEERGVHVVPVDISEFFGKGGGGPKCMVFNLGEVDPDEPEQIDAVRAFRHDRSVRSLRNRGHFPQ